MHRQRLWLMAVLAAAVAFTTSGAVKVETARGAVSNGLASCRRGGVLVAVDFAHWGGPIDLGCARLRPHGDMNGLEAMHEAGFVTAGDEADGDAFVCRIGLLHSGARSERPTPAAEACVSTPPANAYWTLWLAGAGQRSWSFGELGAASYQPSAGALEAWTFGSGSRVRVSPSQLREAATRRLPGVRVVVMSGPSSSARSEQTTGTPAGLLTTVIVVVLLGSGAALAVRRRRVR